MADRLYPELFPWDLEPHYTRHVGAMTSEGLHSKAEIATQLAWRDKQLEELKEAPRLLADWQSQNDGQVMWSSSSESTVCALIGSDNRAAVGHSGARDPFGAARVALKNWAEKWSES